MRKKSWERKECDGCKSYNPECRQGACSVYLHKEKDKASEEENYDTS